MKKWKCQNINCPYSCEVRSNIEPTNCIQRNLRDSDWQEMVADLQPDLQDKPLPKLTAEVFDREDCPKWANWAAVDATGDGFYYEDKPLACEADGEWLVDKRIVGTNCIIIDDFDHTDWQNSLIERPAKLPEWAEIGGYVFDCKNGYGKIVSGSVKSLHIEFTGGEGDFSPNAIKHQLQQARLRPYTAEEMRGLVGKVVCSIEDKTFLVLSYSGNTVFFGDFSHTPEDLTLEIYKFPDGSPCGVLEHMENGEWVE